MAWGVVLGASVCASTAAPELSLNDAIGRARTLVHEKTASKVPGASIAVGMDGKIVWSEGFGLRDIAAKLPVTTTTRFRIGSISKSLTAVGLVLLVERGQLDLDAPVQQYVPGFPDKGARITTRLLGGHLAGIRHYRGEEMLLNRPFSNVQAGLTIFQDDPLEAPPGTKYVYSTYGWTLISAAMESAAGEDFPGFMEASVIRPLGMVHTRPDRAGVVDSDRSQFYESDADGKFVAAPTVDNSYKWAGGGYLSTPEDLVRLGSALLQPGFLKKESLALLFTSQEASDGKQTGYGIGWRVGTDAQGHRILMHTGSSTGGRSVLLLHPETKTVLALVCNHSETPFRKEDWESITESFAPLLKAAAARN
jgi:CubicO group peptidase (beta-lactamase class C family)